MRPPLDGMLRPQVDYLEMMPRVDQSIRMESFAEDVCRLPFVYNPTVPHVNRTKHWAKNWPWINYYQQHYDVEKMLQACRDFYAADFERLDYSLEIP